MFDLLFLLVPILLMVIAFSWGRQSPKSTSGDQQSELEAKVPAPIEVQPSDEEHFVTNAEAEKERWQQEQLAIAQVHSKKMGAIREHLDRALKLVNSSGAGTSACEILGVIWHWPSWSRQENWDMPLLIEGLEGSTFDEDGSTEQGQWLAWKWHEYNHRLELTIRADYVGSASRSGDLRFFVDNELVMHLDVSQRPQAEYYTWKHYGVCALKPGIWMTHINELAGRLTILDGQSRRDYEEKLFGERARNVELS